MTARPELEPSTGDAPIPQAQLAGHPSLTTAGSSVHDNSHQTNDESLTQVTSTFLATDQADIHVHYAGIPDPLIRFEYVRSSKEPPGAHIQVHAHRDEMAYLLRLADAGRPKQGFRRRRLPRLSEMHFPVGGHRMRPSLEDVLLLLKREFAIDTADGWRAVIDEHLKNWRDIQLMSAVRDAPEAAAEVLRGLGYTVNPPELPSPRAPSDQVKLYWP